MYIIHGVCANLQARSTFVSLHQTRDDMNRNSFVHGAPRRFWKSVLRDTQKNSRSEVSCPAKQRINSVDLIGVTAATFPTSLSPSHGAQPTHSFGHHRDLRLIGKIAAVARFGSYLLCVVTFFCRPQRSAFQVPTRKLCIK